MKTLLTLIITCLSTFGLSTNAYAYAGTLHKRDYHGCVCIKAIGSKDGPKNCSNGAKVKSMVKDDFGNNSGLLLSRITLWFYENADCKNRGAEVKKWSDELSGIDSHQNHSYRVTLNPEFNKSSIKNMGYFTITRGDKP